MTLGGRAFDPVWWPRPPRPEVNENSQSLTEEIAPSALLDSTQAALRLGTTPDILVDWRVDRKGPPYLKLTNGMVRYQVHDLLAPQRSGDLTHPCSPELTQASTTIRL